MRLSVTLRSEGVGSPPGWECAGTIVDVTLAGAGIETEEPLRIGDRVAVALSTPTLWDPLILTAMVAWAHPARTLEETDPLGRPRSSARAGLTFDYPTPDATFAMFEMLVAIGYE